MTELEEAIQAIEFLNENLLDNNEPFCSEYRFNLTTDLCGIVIALNDTVLYKSYDHARVYTYRDGFESLNDYCLRKLRQHTDALISILN